MIDCNRFSILWSENIFYIQMPWFLQVPQVDESLNVSFTLVFFRVLDFCFVEVNIDVKHVTGHCFVVHDVILSNRVVILVIFIDIGIHLCLLSGKEGSCSDQEASTRWEAHPLVKLLVKL